MKILKLSEIHNCEKSRDKIVSIATDTLGNTYCGYCGEKVDYRRHIRQMEEVC